MDDDVMTEMPPEMDVDTFRRLEWESTRDAITAELNDLESPLVVYAVMRGTVTLRLYARKGDADWYAEHLNEVFKRGKRAATVPMEVRENNA